MDASYMIYRIILMMHDPAWSCIMILHHHLVQILTSSAVLAWTSSVRPPKTREKHVSLAEGSVASPLRMKTSELGPSNTSSIAERETDFSRKLLPAAEVRPEAVFTERLQ